MGEKCKSWFVPTKSDCCPSMACAAYSVEILPAAHSMIRPSSNASGSGVMKDLSQVFEQCLELAKKEKKTACVIFTQLVVVGCVRAGLTRLDKRLVFVFDLK
jgi:hypothetical protein